MQTIDNKKRDRMGHACLSHSRIIACLCISDERVRHRLQVCRCSASNISRLHSVHVQYLDKTKEESICRITPVPPSVRVRPSLPQTQSVWSPVLVLDLPSPHSQEVELEGGAQIEKRPRPCLILLMYLAVMP